MLCRVAHRMFGSPSPRASLLGLLRRRNHQGIWNSVSTSSNTMTFKKNEEEQPNCICSTTMTMTTTKSAVGSCNQYTASATMMRSLSTHAVDDTHDQHEVEEDFEEEQPSNESNNRNDSVPQYAVEISESGQHICVTFLPDHDHNNDLSSSSISWTFASPLIWVNDPLHIHPTSGQRTRTLGQYGRGTAILRGSVVDAASCNNSVQENNSTAVVLHPPPLPGSFHPRGGIYQYSNDNNNNKKDRNDSRRNRLLLQVEWNSGEISNFDLFWLTTHANSGRMGFRMSLDDMKIAAKNDDSKQHYTTMTARGCHPSVVSSPSTFSDTQVTKDIAIRSMDGIGSSTTCSDVTASLPTMEYHDVMDHEEAVFHAMQGIYEYGAVLLRNAPVLADDDNPGLDDAIFQEEQESIVGNLGKKFSGGTLSHGSLYGDVFHVKFKHDAENIAYTNVGLPPHQDLTYYESKPFLQLLHCVSSGSIVGGESVLIDSMAAAEELRKLEPNLFDTLCWTEATFLKERAGADMVSLKPHIRTDPSLGHVVDINWSPPFEGPLQLCPHYSVQDYVQAYQALEIMLNDQWGTNDDTAESLLPKQLEEDLRDYAKQYTWQYALQRGDILVFNNQRMLHGRREFTAVGNGQRHLIGCYTDAMDTTSRYRQLLRERGGTGGGGYGKRNPGSGCRWM